MSPPGHDHASHRHGAHHHASDDEIPAGFAAEDPVCGMTVDTRTALAHEHAGQRYYFCSARCRDRFAAAPAQFLRGAAAAAKAEPTLRPAASSTCGPARCIPRFAGRSRRLPDLRHGARAARADGRRGRERRARRHDAAVLARRRAQRAAVVADAGRDLVRDRSDADVRTQPGRVARARARDAGRAVRRLAVPRARLAIRRDVEPEHVHADRARHARGVELFRARDARAGRAAGVVPQRRRRAAALLRGGRGDRHARAARPGARAARAIANVGRDSRAAEARAEDRASRRCGGRGSRRAARRRAGRRPAARAARREDSGRRRGDRRRQPRRRVDADGRVPASSQIRGRGGVGRHDERERHAS